MDYTAPAAGARLRAKAAGAQAEATVARPHDPPPLPSPDRVPRGEVYAKEWARLDLGTLRLEKGPATLTLERVDGPAGPALEVQAVYLERVP